MADYRLRAVLGAVDNASKTINQVGNSIGSLAKGFALGDQASKAFTSTLKGLANVLNTGIKFEQTQVAFETMMGSAEQGQAMLRDLYDFAEQTPFEIPGVLQSARELMAMGTEATDIVDTLNILGDIASGVGTERLGQLTLAYGQVQTATKLTGMELRQFTEAGVPLLQELSDITGMSASKIKSNMEKGMIVPADLVKKALENTTKEGGRFFNLLEKQSKTLGGAVSNLKDSFTRMSADIGVAVSSALGPLVNKIAAFVRENGNAIISFITASIAVGVFIYAISNLKKALTGIWTIIKILPALMSPVVLVFGILAALLGVVVYKAMNTFMAQMKKTTDAAVEGSKNIGDSADEGLGEAEEAAKNLTKQLAKIDEQMAKSERDFKESLAKIVQDTKATINDLEKELKEETDSFNKENSERVADFTKTQDKLAEEHAKKVAEIQAQIDEEVGYGWLADQERLADLRAKLAEENADYDAQFSENKTKYEEDTLNSKTEHEKKMLDLQARLQTENDLLNKHKDDVLSIQGIQLQDEIEALKRNHQEQMDSYRTQKDEIIDNAQKTGAGMVLKYNEELAKGASVFEDTGEAMGQAMGNALKDAFVESFKQTWNNLGRFWNNLKTMGAKGQNPDWGLGDLFKNAWNDAFKDRYGPAFASGTSYAPGGMALVGEQGPEIVNLPRGSQVIPNDKLGSIGNNITINIYGNINNKDGLSPEEIGSTIGRQIQLSRQGAY